MIAVYGGCFNPMTKAHQEIILSLERNKEIEKVIVIPVGDNYSKLGLIKGSHRIEILKTVSNKNIEINDIEVKSDTVLTTYETLKKLQLIYRDKELRFVLGADNLLEFETWDNSSDILSEFGLIIINRDNTDVYNIVQSDTFLRKFKDKILKINTGKIKDGISSSNVRNIIKQDNDYVEEHLNSFLNTETLNYIKQNKLYLN